MPLTHAQLGTSNRDCPPYNCTGYCACPDQNAGYGRRHNVPCDAARVTVGCNGALEVHC